VSYINISGTFYYLCSIPDGRSRYIVNWDLRESMTEADIEIILERAKELHPEARPRIVSDNGPQFIAKDFKEFIRVSGMTVRTSPYYPQSNGKIERWHKSPKGECIRPGTPLSLEDARRLVEGCVEHDNDVRLNSAIGLHHAEGHARRPSAGDPRGARPEVGRGAEATADSPPASRLTFSSPPLGVVLDRLIRTSPGASTSGLPTILAQSKQPMPNESIAKQFADIRLNYHVRS
jgi:transposase InsO family protein